MLRGNSGKQYGDSHNKMGNNTRAVFATFINQAWRIVAGPVILLLIPLYLSEGQQGYWYTFISLAALSIFADLGFGMIVLQFAAHEFISLRLDPRGNILGDSGQIQRLASFFRFAVKWGVRAAAIAFPIIYVGGYIFLTVQDTDTNVPWRLAWTIYSLVSGVIFFNNILLTFFEGCNLVAKLQKIRFQMSVVSSMIMLAGLLTGSGLYALIFSGCASALVGVFFLIRNFRHTVIQLWKASEYNIYNWWPEFSSLMWRYALSWCSGYFGLNAYTPIAFYFCGPVEAGKIGLSMAMWQAGFGIANCWITAVIPQLNMMIEEKKWNELDSTFKKAFGRSLMTIFAGGSAFLALYLVAGNFIPIFQRVLSFDGMGILFLCWTGQLIINNWAIYLRAHKKEPLMQFSIVSCMCTFTASLLCVIWLPYDYLFLGFLSSMIWGIPFVWRIYNNQRKAHFLENK